MRRYLSSLTAVLVAVMFCFGTGGFLRVDLALPTAAAFLPSGSFSLRDEPCFLPSSAAALSRGSPLLLTFFDDLFSVIR